MKAMSARLALAVGAPSSRAASARHATATTRRIGHTLWAWHPRHFVKFTFLKVDPAWRRRDPAERARDKEELAAACRDFAEDHFLRVYSTVRTRGDGDLMIRCRPPALEPIHELHVVLNQSGLMRWADISHSFLAMTKESVYSDEPQPLRP